MAEHKWFLLSYKIWQVGHIMLINYTRSFKKLKLKLFATGKKYKKIYYVCFILQLARTI